MFRLMIRLKKSGFPPGVRIQFSQKCDDVLPLLPGIISERVLDLHRQKAVA